MKSSGKGFTNDGFMVIYMKNVNVKQFPTKFKEAKLKMTCKGRKDIYHENLRHLCVVCP